MVRSDGPEDFPHDSTLPLSRRRLRARRHPGLQAADITGKWTAQVPGRDGQTRETTFDFKVEGEKLTGTTTGINGDVPITDGTVKGDAIAFTVVANFNGNDVKILYKGTVAGDEIKFTRQREGGDRLHRVRRLRKPSQRENDSGVSDRLESFPP